MKEILSSLKDISGRLTAVERANIVGAGANTLPWQYVLPVPGGQPASPKPFSSFTSKLNSTSLPTGLDGAGAEADPGTEGQDQDQQASGGQETTGQTRPATGGVPPLGLPQGFHPAHVAHPGLQYMYPVQFPTPELLSGPAPQPDANLKGQFEAIRSSVSRTVLQPEWILADNKSGIASADREQAAIIARSAKHVETELKLMQEIQEVIADSAKVAEYLDKLYVVQKAHMRYLQEEYSGVQIGGRYGPQAKAVFRDIRRQTSTYTPALVDDIKTVLNITGGQQRPSFRGRGHQRGRGGFHGNGYRGRRPGSNSYQPRHIPPNRDEIDM